MLILVPLKTQENAVAKWKGGKKELTKWEAVVFSRLEKGTLRKLESKTESGKRNVKEWLFLSFLSSVKVKECITNSLKETGNSSVWGSLPCSVNNETFFLLGR